MNKPAPFALIVAPVTKQTHICGMRASAQTELVMSYHPIQSRQQQMVIGAARPLNKAAKRELAVLLDNDSVDDGDAGWISDRLLYRSASAQLWYRPGTKRMMAFQYGGRRFRYQVCWPSLVFHQLGNNLRVAAYFGRIRPTHSTAIYHAPLWNIDENGYLCAGSATTANAINDGSQAVWEEAVYDTQFSHDGHARLVRKADENKGYLRWIAAKAITGSAILASECYRTGLSLRKWAEARY